MLLEKLKLSKPLVKSMTEAGFLHPKEVQARSMSRIIGGQDLIISGPEGTGKTTTYVLGVLTKLKYGVEEAPRALILVPDQERIDEVKDRFQLLNRNDSIRVVCLYPDGGVETQMDALADGADIVIASPDRARAVYLKLGLNLNKIQLFIVDDAAEIIRRGMQLPVSELARSIIKCQHLIITEVIHEKLHQLIDPFMKEPVVVEVSLETESELNTCEQFLYLVPDFKGKISLLSNLLQDDSLFEKVVVFVNTRLTAEKIFKQLFKQFDEKISLYKPLFFDHPGFDHIDDFKMSDTCRILLVADDLRETIDLNGIPFLFHMEIPLERETYVSRVLSSDEQVIEQIAINFATDIELVIIKKIEGATGKIMPILEMPEEVKIDISRLQQSKKKTTKPSEEELIGAAFHEKKKSNAKDYNYTSREKAKMKFKNR